MRGMKPTAAMWWLPPRLMWWQIPAKIASMLLWYVVDGCQATAAGWDEIACEHYLDDVRNGRR